MRGQRSKVGDTRTSPNGYHYTRTEKGWVTTHTIIMEKSLGRKLEANERVRFKDGNKRNLSPSNLEVRVIQPGSRERRIAQLRTRIEDMQAQLEDLLNEELG